MCDMAAEQLHRKVESDGAIQSMAKTIGEKLNPVAVLLFGSRARGDARPDSDTDLFVILHDDADVDEEHLRIYNALSSRFPKDVVVSTVSVFMKRARLPGTVQRDAYAEGILLWGQEVRGPLPLLRKPGDPSGDLEEYAAQFLRDAEDDLNICGDLSTSARHHVRGRAFHAQQATENGLKCALAISGRHIKRIHDLDELASDIPSDWSIPYLTSDLKKMSKFAVTGRYGDDSPDPTKADADWAYGMASGIVSIVRDEAMRRGL